MALSVEQAKALRFVSSGHNLLITGQAGVGKSRLFASILQDCHARKLKASVVCSSGIACKVYSTGVASTVHSFYGLGTADLPSNQVLERSISNSVVARRLHEVDVIVWDEMSMSSARMLELVNCLHHELAAKDCIYPFGGKQVILVGQFLQLHPVPSTFDEGNFMFESPAFQFAFCHRIELTQIMRQSPEELEFAKALEEVRLGLCSQESYDYLKNLSRDLDPDGQGVGI